MKNANNYTIDIMNNTIILSKAFYKRATSNINNPEYKELKSIIADYPTCTIQLREIKKNPNKTSYRNLTYENMERYIRANEKNPDIVMARFHNIKESSHAQTSRYAYVKKWFLQQYPDYTEIKTEQETVTTIAIAG